MRRRGARGVEFRGLAFYWLISLLRLLFQRLPRVSRMVPSHWISGQALSSSE